MIHRMFLVSALICTATCLQIAELRVADIQKGEAGLSAIVEHDCAPWDSAAFGLWIPAERFGGKPDSWIYLRIWQEPAKSQISFVFPAKTENIGNVIYYLDLKSPQSIVWQNQPRRKLKGRVRFIRINEKEPVLGEIDFLSEDNVQLKGSFEALWIKKMVLCG